MPKLSTGRKIMLETITVDPFTGAILRSCEIKFVFNSASKPLLLELVSIYFTAQLYFAL